MEQNEIIETQKRIIDTISYGVSEAIIITDPSRRITHFNKAAEKLTGFNIVDVINKPIEEILRFETDQGNISIEDVCPASDFDIDGTVYKGKSIKIISNNKKDEIVNVRSIKVRGGKEVNLGSIIFIENTFEKSELERMKLDFVSMSEHVLRTPITVIRGYLSRLLMDRTTSKLDEGEINYLKSAQMGTDELLALIENLIIVTELRKGDPNVDPINIALEPLVTKVVNELKLVGDEKGIRIVYVPPADELPMVKADVSKIKIVLQNLLENAIKYSDEGTITVTTTPKNKEVEIAVKDNGRGIPSEYISQLFTKFYRVKKALQMEYGMGLGLYISKKIIDAHGGRIWVESKDEVGSTFYFTLPTINTNETQDL